MKKFRYISLLLLLMVLSASVPVCAEAESDTSAITIDSISYEVTGANSEFISITANCTENDNVTAVSVMVVPENTEAVTLDKVIYLNRFAKSADGVYNFTMSKNKILEICNVEKYALAELSLRMGTDVSSVPAMQTISLDEVIITEVLPLRTHSVAFDNEAKTINVKALSGNATAGFGIVTEGDSSWVVNAEDKTRLELTVSNASTLNGAQVVVARQANGMQQTFEVDITCGTKTETYTVSFEFIDESLINFTDIAGVRIYSYDVNAASHKVTIIADRYNVTSAGFGFILPENVTAEYTLLETSDGGTAVSSPTSSAYTSTYLGMDSGYYGAKLLKVLPISNGVTQVMQVVLTNTTLNESITWTVNLLFRDPAHEGDVDISEIIGLRTTSAVFDNEAKTITLVADSSQASAGCTVVSDSPSVVRQLTAESGKNLAYGTIDGSRYVVAYQIYGATQTYRIKVFGGEDGYEYSWYTVTLTFDEGEETASVYALTGSDETEEIVWVDDYEESLEEIPGNLVWDENLMDYVPATTE